MPRAGTDNYLVVRSSYRSWYRVESTRQYYLIPIEAVTSPLNDQSLTHLTHLLTYSSTDGRTVLHFQILVRTSAILYFLSYSSLFDYLCITRKRKEGGFLALLYTYRVRKE